MSKSITSCYMKAMLLMVFMLVMPSLAMADKEMWVGWNGTTHTLTFFYNESKEAAEFDAKYEIPTTSATEIPQWHEKSSEIQTVVIDPSFADARPTLTTGWFYDIPSITTIKGLEYLNTSEVTSMRAMFAYCSKLSSIDVSHFDTSNATDLSAMFGACTSLTELDLSHFNTSKVVYVHEMFADDAALTKLNLSGFDMSSIKMCSQMFQGCSALKEIWVNDSFSIPNYTDGNSVNSTDMFKGCTSLPHFDANKLDKTLATLYQNGGYLYSTKVEPWVEYADNALTFHYDNQRYLKVQNGLQSTIYDYDPTISTNPSYGWAAQKANATRVSFDESFAQVTPATLKGFFKNFSALTSVEGLKNLNATVATSMSEMFYGCSALPSISLEMTDGEKVAETTRMFYGCSALKSVTFPSEGVKLSHVTDTRSMFEKCSLLTDVDFTNLSATSLVDMQGMFIGCAALKDIDLSQLITSSASDMSYLFKGCTSLKNVTFSSSSHAANTEGVSDMSYMFQGCEALETLDLSSFNTGKVTTMASMFSGCSSLTSLDLSGFNTEKVTTMASMFSGCSSLTSLDLSSFNTEAVTNMSSMFSGCATMKTLPISGFNTAKVTTMASMFKGCAAMKGLQPTNFNTEKVTDMSSMFEGCTSLHAVDITSFATVTSSGNYARMFADNANLRYIFDNKIFTLSSEGTYTDMFASTPNLPNYKAAEVDATHATPDSYAGGYLTTPSYGTISWVEVTDTATMVFRNDQDYFARCFGHHIPLAETTPTWIKAPEWLPAATNVTKVIFTDAFASERPTSCYQWFKGLSKLTEIEGIENLVTDDVTTMQEMFSGCSALQKIDVTAFLTETVTSMKQMFAGCSTIKTLDLTGWNTEKVTDMTQMFYNDASLETIYAGYGFVTTNVTDDLSAEMFYGSEKLTNYDAAHTDRTKAVFTTQGGCLTMTESKPWVAYDDKQQSLTLHYGFRTVSTSTVHTYELGDDYTKAAWRNLVIKQVYIAKDMTEYRPTSLKGLFQGLSSLERVNNLSYINFGAVTDMSNMFAQCHKLSYPIYFDKADLTSVQDMSGMFAYCDSLSVIDFAGVATSALTSTADMFAGCTKLQNVDLSSFYTANVTDMARMFFGCESLTKIDLTSFNTAKVTDMAAMFARCQSAKIINLSSFNTASVTNMNLMFNNCAAVDTIYASSSFVPSESCTGLGMFYGCENLFSYNAEHDGIDMAKSTEDGGYLTYGHDKAWVGYNQETCVLTFHFDDLKGKVEGENFTYDFQLKYDDLADIPWKGNNAKKVVIDSRFAKICPTSMAYWFYGMTNLKTFEGLEYLNTSNVTDMSKMFANCNNLDSLDLSSFNTANVETMEQMFLNCLSLKKVNLSSFNTARVSNMTKMFQDCSSLSMLDLRSFNTNHMRYAGYMFSQCTNLQRILVTKDFLPICGIEETQYMFDGDVKLYEFDPTKIDGQKAQYIADGGYLDEYNGKSEPWAAYYPEAKTLKFFYNPDRLLTLDSDTYKSYQYTADNETYANYPWAETCKENTETVVFDESYADKENTNLRRIFADYTNLKTIEGLKNLNTSSVTSMADMFTGCKSLTSLDLSTLDTKNVQSMANMFDDCQNLTDLNVSGLNVQSLQEAKCMFMGCSSLKSLTLDWKNATSLTSIGDMFNGCKSLTELDLSSLNTQKVTTMYRMFQGCSGLKDINLTDFSTAKATQMDYMFRGCTSLNMLDLTSFYTANVKSTAGMFEACDSLVAIYTSDTFALSSDCSSTNMFNASPLLPAYDATKVDKSKACYYSKGGYFFSKTGTKPWVDVYTQRVEEGQTIRDNMTITFHYDDAWEVYQDSLGHDHATYEMPTENLVTPGWVTYINGLDDVYTTTVKFNPSFSLYRPTTCYKWFYNVHYLGGGFKGLEYLNTSDVTNMDYMFYDTNFPSIDLSHFNTENVTSMTYMFYGQHLCHTLDLRSFNTSKVTDMTGMFSGCTSLNSIDLSSFNTSEVISMAHMFERVCHLTSLDLTSFNIGKVTDMSYMFNHEASGNYRGCNLTNIYVNEDFVLGEHCLADKMFVDATTLPHYDGTIDKTHAHYKEGGYLTLRRQFSVGDTKYNADGWGDETTCYDDVTFTDGAAYSSAFSFSFSAANTASYTRTTKNHWATLCLPFAFSADNNSTARFYSVKSYTEGNIAVNQLTGTIEAGTPVLAYVSGDELSVSATGAAAVAKAKQLTELKGVFAQTEVADDDYIIANDHFWNVAWLKQNNADTKNVYVAPYRAYLTLDLSTGAKPNSISITEGETDGIDSIDGAASIDNLLDGAELYDLQGRRLNAPQRGVIIVRKGGVSRKVVVK